VASARGVITGRQFTLHSPEDVITFSLPVHDRVNTIFNRGGYMFEWAVLACSIAVWILLLLF
jgi:hypothetical protein